MGVGDPTVPRGPIAAQFGSPGPCYALPGLVGQKNHDPRSVHNKNPGWPLLGRHSMHGQDQSPGPCYSPGKVFRDGVDGTPQYSIYSRPRDVKLNAGPGPGAYKSENALYLMSSSKSPPKYSFGSRHKEFGTDNSPGPCVYQVDPMLGKTVRSNKSSAPNYSLVGRSKQGGFHEDLQKTPGPGAYKVTDPGLYKDRAPQNSVTGRNIPPGDSTQKPGPGAYYPDQRRSINGPSFGIRHSQYSGTLVTDVDKDF